MCLQLLDTTWSPQIKGSRTQGKAPAHPPPSRAAQTTEVRNAPPESTAPAPRDGPTFIRPPAHPRPIDSFRTRARPARPRAGAPRCPRLPSLRKEVPDGGNSRHRGGGNTRRSSARGPRRVGTPRALTPLLKRARPAEPEKPRSRPVGLRASPIRPPNSRPARTPRRPGAGEGSRASSGAGGRKRGGRKMARSARA